VVRRARVGFTGSTRYIIQIDIRSGTLQAIDIGYLVKSKDKRKAGKIFNVEALEKRFSNFEQKPTP
jgi:hypothetical protein